MAETRVRATANVQVVVQIEAEGVWGDSCTLAQVHKQAKEDVEGQLRRVQEAMRNSNMRLINVGPVKTIITYEER